jgi:hypothetical protein
MRLHRLALLTAALGFAAPLCAQLDIEGPQDSLAGAPTINHCTLRKAVINANDDAATYPQCRAGVVGADTIVFDFAGTITFALTGANEDFALTGDLDIRDSLTITGHTDGTVIDAASLDRIFDINPGNAHPGIIVTLNNLTITNGSANGGGAIRVNNATLNLNNVTISNSFADGGDGGAIWLTNGATLNMTNCTISGNHASFYAGAILVDSGTTAHITNSTITANYSGFTNRTGGIRNLGTTTLRNTIVSGNLGADLPNLDGTFTSNGFNIIGNLGTMGASNPVITPNTGDQISVNHTDVHLGPLQNNGGPTSTHALLTSSIALDKGHSSGSTTDQRGLTRPCDDATIANATGGDGGDVGAFENQVACANSPPDAVDDSVTILEDSGANTIDVLANDTDPNSGDTLTVTAVTQGTHGTVVNNSTSVSYTPNHDFFGTDSFTYTIDDGHSATDTATVHVTVTNVNDPPIANADTYNMNQDTTISPAAPGVVGNDTDVDGDALTAHLATNVSHGTLALSPSGAFTYTPAPGFAGIDSFTYKANDGTVDSNAAATVTIHIADTQPPVINASLAINSLWPPNHDMVNVGLAFSATDNTGVASTQLAVFSDEDDVAPAGGEESPDAMNIGPGTLRLRSERSGNGDGRVYLIRVTATDGSSNTSRACLSAVVPKSQSAADVSSVNLQAQAARAQCTATGTPPAGYFVVGDGPVIGPKR